MAITPDTNIRLLKVPLSLNNKHQLTFTNKENQFNYFWNLPHINLDECSYQRKNNIIRFGEHIDNLLNYNYVMYENSNYDDKWFYAFIINMNYVNDNMTEIQIATDVFQTWQFDIQWKQSFIEREMCPVNDDFPGANLIPEGLEFGELKNNSSHGSDNLYPVCILAYTRNPSVDGLTQAIIPEGQQGFNVNGIPTGVFYCISSLKGIATVIEMINSRGYADSIMTIFTVPAVSVLGFNNYTIDNFKNDSVHEWIYQDFKASPIIEILDGLPTSLDGYVPRNQKLRTYPYCYFGFNPPNGSQNIYRYENFRNNPSFKIISEINQNPSVYFIPQNYMGVSGDNLENASVINGYPTLGWTSEYFNAWLAQNSEIINLNMRQEAYNYKAGLLGESITGTSNIISSAYGNDKDVNSSNISGVISSSANFGLNLASKDINHEYYVKQQLAQIEKQQLLPNQATMGGSNATLLGYNLLGNSLYNVYTIKEDYAKRIDEYFDMYGYASNHVKLPNLNNRPNWNYIKTIGANILGNIPQLDLQEIKNMFDNGITLWHNPNTFLDYAQNNR